jgi:hypothetical protein
MKYQKHNLHQHRCWTKLWHHSREKLLSMWSRFNLEGRNTDWSTAPTYTPASVAVAGVIEYGDERRWKAEAKALWESSLWER